VPSIRNLARRVAERVARIVAEDELFEKPGERRAPEPISAPVSLEPIRGRALVEAVDNAQLEKRLSSGSLIVNHWATWCDGCIEELPDLRKLQDRCPGDVQLIGVGWELFTGAGIEDALVRVQEVSAEHSLSHPTLVLTDPPSEFFADFGVEVEQIPQTWLMQDGEVIERIHGLLDEESCTRLLGLLGQS
jgi:thiol-disulfide isomerase/thioredoxin